MEVRMSIRFLSVCITVLVGILDAAVLAGAQTSRPAAWDSKPGLYAVLKTNMGTIVCELFPDQAPKTVANFVGLAEGTKEYTDPRTSKKTKGRYFDGTIFHRVIPGFMIQGGDPTGTGRGTPGYEFENEIVADLTFDRPGRLAMANRGPDTNGSQFFITHVPVAYLNGNYTIFGQVVEGQEVVNRIGDVPRDQRDKPRTDVVLETVTIRRVE